MTSNFKTNFVYVQVNNSRSRTLTRFCVYKDVILYVVNIRIFFSFCHQMSFDQEMDKKM